MSGPVTVTFTRGRQSDDTLKLSLDRKVSPTGWYQASRGRWQATLPNSFGLPPRATCPGLTPFCDSCYAINSQRSAGVAGLLHHNYRLLTDARSVDGMAVLLAEMVGRYKAEADRRDLPPGDRLFRIHWSGDFFSSDYATAWAQVISANPDTRFWAYTRSFVDPVNVIPELRRIDNLMVYLSVDVWNADQAAEQSTAGNVHLAVCDVDYSSARNLAAFVTGDESRTPVVCPENNGRMQLMADGRGACVECRLCPDGRRDVIFSTTHREHRAVPVPAASIAAAAACGVCANPACGATLHRRPGRGRPPKYCKPACRWAVYRLSKTPV